MRALLIVGAGLVIGVGSVLLGGWWMPFLVGLAFGLALRRTWIAVIYAAAVGLVAWLVPLAVLQLGYGLGPSAGALAAIMGFGHSGAVPVVLTLLTGTLIGLCGAWLAGAARPLVRVTR